MERTLQINEIDGEAKLAFRKQFRYVVLMALVGAFMWVSSGWNDSLTTFMLKLGLGFVIGGVSFLSSGALITLFLFVYMRLPTTAVEPGQQMSQADTIICAALMLSEVTIALAFALSIVNLFADLVWIWALVLPIAGQLMGIWTYFGDFFEDIIED